MTDIIVGLLEGYYLFWIKAFLFGLAVVVVGVIAWKLIQEWTKWNQSKRRECDRKDEEE